MVGFVPPDLWAAVEVEPDEQRLDLEEVELGLRALWEAVATDLVEDIRVPVSISKWCPNCAKSSEPSKSLIHAAANAIAIAMDGAVRGSRGWKILANSQKGGGMAVPLSFHPPLAFSLDFFSFH